MAKLEFPGDKELQRLKRGRAKARAVARRHHNRRRRALLSGRKEEAKRELLIYRRWRERAQEFERHVRGRRAYLRERKKANWLKRHWHKKHAPVKGWPGVVWFDGKMCAEWIAKELDRIRAAGRWKGYLRSGFRTPAYSESLCYGICGHDHCPGLCAGSSSNHSGRYYPDGAADVSDEYRFAKECERLDSPLRNHLPRDRVHFSSSGN